jgi:crotonobetainyl-CoA:carnitine CoA-transferase CaiB-like acyl-CoA transferase
MHVAPDAARVPADELPPPQGREFDLLAGTRVLDLTGSIAGPYATLLLADLGADVVKVEQPGIGDDTRAWGPPFLDGESLWYLSVNRNKRSLALDYSTPKGYAILQRLVRTADVVVTNARPATQRKLGVDYASLCRHRSDVIVCSITGFGLAGDRADMGSYDLIAEGYSGVMDVTGDPSSGPQKIGTPAADLLAGMDAAFAIVAALYDRQVTGRGHLIDVNLLESMTRFLTPRLVGYLGSGLIPTRSGGTDSVIAIYQTFRARDGLLTLGLGNDRIFRRFCDAIGRPEWARDPRFADNVQRRHHRAELVEAIQALLSERRRDEWLDLLAAAGVPAGPINTVAEVCADEALRSRGMLYSIPHGNSVVPQVGTGWHLEGDANSRALVPPPLGEGTDPILRQWAELTDAEIALLRADGTVQ